MLVLAQCALAPIQTQLGRLVSSGCYCMSSGFNASIDELLTSHNQIEWATRLAETSAAAGKHEHAARNIETLRFCHI